MITFPRLKTFLCVFPVSDTTWGLRGGTDEQWRVKLTDARAVQAFGALLPYLNGQTRVEDMLDAIERTGFHREAASAVLRQLEASSLLEDADPHGLSEADLRQFDHQIRFFSRFTQQGGAKMQAALRDSRVALIGDGPLAASMDSRLTDAGIGTLIHTTSDDVTRDDLWIDPLTTPQLLIVCQEAHDPRLLEAIDTLSKRRLLPWLLVRNLDLQEGWVGPLFVPGETASYLSLEARLRANMSNFAEYQAFDTHVRESTRPPLMGGLHASHDLLASIAAIEAIKFLTEIKVPELLGRFLTINYWTWETELHDVLRMPALDRTDASSPRPTVFPWKIGRHDDSTSALRRA